MRDHLPFHLAGRTVTASCLFGWMQATETEQAGPSASFKVARMSRWQVGGLRYIQPDDARTSCTSDRNNQSELF